MNALEAYIACEERGLNLNLGNGALRIDGPSGALTPDLKAALVEHKASVRAILEAEAKYMALWRRVCALTDDGATPEQRAEAETLIHGELWECQCEYLTLAGLR